MDSSLYPKLSEHFKDAGVCPICLSNTDFAPKYICENQHAICYRCKVYYHGCPTCHSPLDLVPAPEVEPPHVPPPLDFVPHPPPPFQLRSLGEFLMTERGTWSRSTLTDEEPSTCRYSELGCWAKVPELLRHIHETRCQFRPFLEEEHLPTDLTLTDDPVECSYASVGCNVRMPEWRRSIHEDVCSFKGKLEALEEPECDGDPEELVDCKFAEYGCLVKMPRRRKPMHELKCNYLRYDNDAEFATTAPEVIEGEEERTDCRWAEYGCRTRPKEGRREIHESICNYRMEECSFRENGCNVCVHPAGKFAHERVCHFAN